MRGASQSKLKRGKKNCEIRCLHTNKIFEKAQEPTLSTCLQVVSALIIFKLGTSLGNVKLCFDVFILGAKIEISALVES